ncbi:MAG: hypothetical protein U9Q34_03360, partial [Elusimicrobiota bacterium]|nr:hypothetical protein [Elusimicrobiota bacterium]
MCKSLISFIILISFPLLVVAGFNLGFIKGVKKKVDQIDEKVIEKKEEIRTADLNSATTLSWTGAVNYISDGLNPEIGAVPTTFEYRVKYTDVNNNPPLGGYPKVHIKKNGTEIAGSPFTMTYVSGTNNTGATYSYSKDITL